MNCIYPKCCFCFAEEKRQKVSLGSDDDNEDLDINEENYQNVSRVYNRYKIFILFISSLSSSMKFTDCNIHISDDEDEEDVPVNVVLRTQVIDVLNNGTEKDLNVFPNMNPKKMELIFANRPYTTWIDAVSTFLCITCFSFQKLF